VQVSPAIAAAYWLQLAAIPVCVDPCAVTAVVVAGLLTVVVTAEAEMPTQYHSFAQREVPQF
jgi:hypothetical protein